MLTIDFAGSSRLIEAIDAALAEAGAAAITDRLRHTLCALIRDEQIRLPDCVFEPLADHYARRELYRSETLGYSVIAMTWGPGQGTPIHDHDGMWCVEGVWNGALEVAHYELVAQDSRRYHFRPAGAIQAAAGSAGSLIPPHEYHAIRNPSAQASAVSLHVYSAPMLRCGVFQPAEEPHWYRRDEHQLTLDGAH